MKLFNRKREENKRTAPENAEQRNGKKEHRRKLLVKRVMDKINFPDLSDNPKVKFLNKYSLAFHGLLACVLVLMIELISRHSLISAMQFCVGSPLTFLYNALLIFATLLIVYLFKSRALVRFVISVFWILLGVINGCILANRVTPFNFTDLKLVGDLLDMKSSKYVSAGEEVIIVVALALLAMFLIIFGIKGPKFHGKVHFFRNLGLLVACVACIPFVTKAAIHSDILAGYFGNLAQGYQEYGFVYSFASSVVDTGMSQPDDYSEETIDAINEEVEEETPATTIDTDDMPNIIFIQLETFIDPYELNFLSYSQDPIPNFHSLMNNYTSGYLTVPVVGAGTANTEFEVLTGMGIQYFGLGEYPYKTVLKDTSCESAADVLGDLGYSTHALHNNGGNFYGRATVFSQMGFDTFTSKELMNITEYNEIDSWPTDDILISEMTKTLNSTEDQSDFVYTITVQSHGSYPTEQVFEDPEIVVTGGETEEINNQWTYYINELHEVDQVIGKLIEQLSQRDEKTLVVMYGDHLPTMGLEDSDMNNGSIYQTTYCTWNNFGMEENDKDVASYQLMSYITDQLGIHEGTIFKLHQDALNNGTTETTEYKSAWEELQYDLLYGERYSYGGVEKYPASDLEMGVEDVVINSTEVDETTGQLVFYGENFTQWSKVYVNGTKIDTTYVSGSELRVALKDLKDGAELVVNQVGSSETIFRSSNAVTFTAPADFEQLQQIEVPAEETEDAEE